MSLGSAPVQIIDGDRGRNYPSSGDLLETGHCLFLSARNVTKRGFDFTDQVFVTHEKDRQLRAGKLQREDVVLTTRGTVGNVAYFGETVVEDHMRINSGMVILRADGKLIDSSFLYSFMRSTSFTDQVESLTSGSAQPQLPIRELRQVLIPVPDFAQQRAIAEMLGALDDKIVANAKLARSASDLAELEFRRLMLRSHESVTLAEVLTLEYGKSLPAGKRTNGPVKVYGSGGIVGKHTEALCDGPGVVVGRKGTAGAVHWASGPFFPIDTTFWAKPSAEWISPIFSYFLLKSLRLHEMNSDSAVPGLNRNEAHAIAVRRPDSDQLREFTTIAMELFDVTSQMDRENEMLATTRDTLLPQLMSGKLRVKEAEMLVEELV
ncbi:restriction endonuclease subunit S [Arthrobacter sp. CAN_C5]|uniref:restriction endonuclease subunit S n=1 Tax=Arthrobacter sp. CAN_C5 TaxID=2760706 RepID=UPI001AE9341E|nr:restriction endonuclease subunit S [Arthrobacter sp. CAN_C5]MBP2216565.1 type I restriction enzyme S subunit [Arthrobacter sp. CAN_C5]